MYVSGLCLAVLSVLLAPSLAVFSYHGYKVFQLQPTEEQLPAVAELHRHPGLDFWTRQLLAGRPIKVMVPPALQDGFRKQLDQHGILHRLFIADVEEVVQKEREAMQLKSLQPKKPGSRITFTEYHQYDEIRQYLSDLVSSYPDKVSVQSIGQTFENRSLDIIQISSGGGGTRPVILIDAGIHAREWIAPAAALYTIQQLVENAAESALTDSVDWHIIPVLNPDGYEYSFTGERFWRKTRSITSSSSCRGVDGNRNFDFHWMEVGATLYPCDIVYAGPEPFSESETRALRDYVLANSARIKLYLTYHSYGTAFLYPWGYTSELPEDWKVLDALAREANAAQLAAGGEPYAIGSSTNILGAAAGGSDDWTKAVGGVNLSYTIELPDGGGYGFAPPPSKIVPIVVPFFEAIRVFGQYVAQNFS